MKKKQANPLDDIDPILKDSFSSKKTKKTDKSYDLNEVEDDIEVQQPDDSEPSVKKIEFPDENQSEPTSNISQDIFNNIPIQVSAELGRCVLTLEDLKNLTEGSLIEFDRFIGESLDLVVNGEIIAKGEVVSVDNKFGLKLKSINDSFQL